MDNNQELTFASCPVCGVVKIGTMYRFSSGNVVDPITVNSKICTFVRHKRSGCINAETQVDTNKGWLDSVFYQEADK